MEIGIIGAGALGGTFAALLDRVGHRVEVTARGDGLAAIRSAGIRLTGAYGDVTARVTANERLTRRPELVLVCTKAQDAEAAVAANRALVDGATVVVVQNGLEGVDTAERLLPSSTCLGLLSLIAADHSGPGLVHVTAAAESGLGRGDGPAGQTAVRIAEVLSEAVPVRAIDDFRGAQWTKLVVNMVNAVPAIVGVTLGEVVAHPGLLRTLTASMHECVRVGIARGVRFGSLNGLDDTGLRAFASSSLEDATSVPSDLVARMGWETNRGSTQQSLRRGQPTEIDFLNGAVVREATAAGLAAPVNAALVGLVHEVESLGHPLPADRVIDLR
ncbi:2-dehydropantoate 2-reductase [Agromyces terreus]|uniref:2-dehydropantoate 2-reductase n=1 Tax=Agromyces terreus TaxID=424795 RepID=A0A9X2H2I1_9MICO|nr:2-dehydropantoate 2-reductase [Agromyces terreus]MCP2371480.1 2-dehydropantoate 2-reductase [Agromyces terreus]